MIAREAEWEILLRSMLKGSSLKASVQHLSFTSTDVYKVQLTHPIGGCTFGAVPDEPYKLAAHIDLKIVENDDRGAGTGRMIVGTLEAFCKEIGLQEIIVGANANPRFWKGTGYDRIPESEANRYRRLANPQNGIDFGIDFTEAGPDHVPMRKLL